MNSPRIRIEGQVSAGFEAVRDAFAENFSRRDEVGCTCCAYYKGEMVVDLRSMGFGPIDPRFLRFQRVRYLQGHNHPAARLRGVLVGYI